MSALARAREKLTSVSINESDRYVAILRSQKPGIAPTDVQGKSFFLGLSLRSPKFNRSLVREFVLLAKRFSSGGSVTTFNYPLIFNILAKGTSVEEFEHEIDVLRKIDRDAERMVERILSKLVDGPPVKFVKFDKLLDSVPETYFTEVRDMFLQHSPFQKSCIDHVRRIFSIPPGEPLGKRYTLVEYFVFELPILLFLAYRFHGGVVDVYPGENAGVVWDFDSGIYDLRCPTIGADRRQSGGLMYVELVAKNAKLL